MSRSILRTSIVAGLAGAALLAAAAASAQGSVEELTVLGHSGPKHQDTLSYAVSYADLDLRTEHGRGELDKRIKIIAKYVCTKLADQERLRAPDESCIAVAIRDGRTQAREAKIRAFRHTGHWKPGPPWNPPPGVG
jgi:UrcA family protein